MNVLRWCPLVYLFDTPFQNSPYGHAFNKDTLRAYFCCRSTLFYTTTLRWLFYLFKFTTMFL